MHSVLSSFSRRVALSAFLCFCFMPVLPSPALAKGAEMLLVPTRVVMEKGARYTTVTIKNSGDATGRYRIELIDASMGEDGGVKLREDGSRDPFSAKDYLSLSPRSMTLKPDQFQTVRLLFKKPADLADGEYRTHLKVKMVENDVDAKEGSADPKAASIAIKPKLVMVIPVIVRHGETSYRVSLDDASIEGNGKNARLNMTLGLEGNRSIVGDAKVTHVDAGGKESLLKFFPGIAIYRGTTNRRVAIPLETPDGVNIESGTIKIALLSQEKEGGEVMAQKEIKP